MPQTVLITGSSTGIGRAAAQHFAAQGWNVAATMRTPEKQSVLAAGPRMILPRLDVTDPASIAAAIAETRERFGAIDALVNNAGYGLVGPFEASTPAQIERQFATNVFGLMNVVREILPYFRERRGGVIINVASMGGRITFPLYSLYHGTKWAVEGFSESLQFELEPFGIRVKVVEPGAIATDFGTRSLDRMQQEGLTAYDAFVQRIVAGWTAVRRASPADLVAEVIWQAATDGTPQLRYVAGEDAKMILDARSKISQEEYYTMVKKRFGMES